MKYLILLLMVGCTSLNESQHDSCVVTCDKCQGLKVTCDKRGHDKENSITPAPVKID